MLPSGGPSNLFFFYTPGYSHSLRIIPDETVADLPTMASFLSCNFNQLNLPAESLLFLAPVTLSKGFKLGGH
jgi:hypothetical protein